NYKRHTELWVEGNLVIITARVRNHEDGEGVYLLCEHLAAYHTEVEEEAISIQVKTSRYGHAMALPRPEAPSKNGGSRTPYPLQESQVPDSRFKVNSEPQT